MLVYVICNATAHTSLYERALTCHRQIAPAASIPRQRSDPIIHLHPPIVSCVFYVYMVLQYALQIESLRDSTCELPVAMLLNIVLSSYYYASLAEGLFVSLLSLVAFDKIEPFEL